MSMGRAWVFRCDCVGCDVMQMTYTEQARDAKEDARRAGWTVERWSVYCPTHGGQQSETDKHVKAVSE